MENLERLRDLFSKFGRRYTKDAVVFLEDEAAEEMFIILSGRVRITKNYQSEEVLSKSVTETHVLAELGPGEFFGEMALLEDLPRSASAIALTDLEVICLKKDGFIVLLEHNANLALMMMRSLSRRLREADSYIRLMPTERKLPFWDQKTKKRTETALKEKPGEE